MRHPGSAISYWAAFHKQAHFLTGYFLIWQATNCSPSWTWVIKFRISQTTFNNFTKFNSMVKLDLIMHACGKCCIIWYNSKHISGICLFKFMLWCAENTCIIPSTEYKIVCSKLLSYSIKVEGHMLLGNYYD